MLKHIINISIDILSPSEAFWRIWHCHFICAHRAAHELEKQVKFMCMCAQWLNGLITMQHIQQERIYYKILFRGNIILIAVIRLRIMEWREEVVQKVTDEMKFIRKEANILELFLQPRMRCQSQQNLSRICQLTSGNQSRKSPWLHW